MTAFYCVFKGMGEKKESFQQFGVLGNAALYVFLVYYTVTAYMSFSYTGGFDGL